MLLCLGCVLWNQNLWWPNYFTGSRGLINMQWYLSRWCYSPELMIHGRYSHLALSAVQLQSISSDAKDFVSG